MNRNGDVQCADLACLCHNNHVTTTLIKSLRNTLPFTGIHVCDLRQDQKSGKKKKISNSDTQEIQPYVEHDQIILITVI